MRGVGGGRKGGEREEGVIFVPKNMFNLNYLHISNPQVNTCSV